MIKIIASALVVSLSAQVADGGATAVEEEAPAEVIDYHCPSADAPIAIDGGYFVSIALERQLTCREAALIKHRDSLIKYVGELQRQSTWKPNYDVTKVISIVCMIAGVIFTYFVKPAIERLISGTPPPAP